MANFDFQNISTSAQRKWLYGIGFTTILILFVAIITRKYFLFLVPPALLFAVILFIDFRKVFYLLIAMIPLSIEAALPGGLSMDLPAEPLIIILMGVFYLYLFKNRSAVKPDFLKHPIVQALLVHVAWILVAAIFAQLNIIAYKFFLAKIWYVTTFVFLTSIFIKDEEDFKTIYWLLAIPIAYGVLYGIFKHAQLGFEFDAINQALRPFFRNHVNYAALLSLFFPFMILARTWYKKGTLYRQIVDWTIVIVFLGIFFAYTRGAWLALFAALGAIFLIKKKLVKPVVTIGIIVLIGSVGALITNNNYLKFAPEFETTVYHGNLKDHLSATTELKDVSGAERIYRWVAALKMSSEHPITGFGPNNFYHHYKQYTVSDFSTYVSDNPEKSGTHNYFLMLLTEQGFVGMFLFAWLTYLIFHYSVRLYYIIPEEKKNFLLAIICSMIIIYVQLMLSDLVEALKIGVFFFINLTLIVNLDVRYRIKKN